MAGDKYPLLVIGKVKQPHLCSGVRGRVTGLKLMRHMDAAWPEGEVVARGLLEKGEELRSSLKMLTLTLETRKMQ
ncbi:hypothetical protein Ciccas_009186 [Cichlidogyrus casuarinus]|uniref:Uncharacterized protein n=1 Tax=Cichlidogyrus casuarinus TaxID=1844966 RepID=A0ABD2PZG5_9PLAT